MSVEIRARVLFDLEYLRFRIKAVDLVREARCQLGVAIEAGVARLLCQSLVDKKLVEQRREAFRARGELEAHFRRHAQEFQFVVGTGDFD